MSLARAVARPMLASVFITGGIDTLRPPGGRPELVRAAGLSEPELLVKVNAGVMTVAGLTLATGRLPRLSCLALAGSLVPTTYVGHPFWSADAAARKQQQIQFFKNLSMLGGLLLAALDTGGRESLPHAAGRLSRRARRRAGKAAAHLSVG
jgi:putative oxidoreductase